MGRTAIVLILTVASSALAGGCAQQAAPLETVAVTLHPPLLGTVKVTSALVFDIGVYLVVIGLAMMVFESFGDDTSVVPAHRPPDAGVPQ